jgi:hypothetical protein
MSNEILLPENAIQVVRGSSQTLALSVVAASGKPFDLTTAVIYMTVKNTLDATMNVFQKTSANILQIEITDPRGGLANVYLVPADTQRLDIRPYVFDVWVVVSANRYIVIPPSTFEVQAGVTFLP